MNYTFEIDGNKLRTFYNDFLSDEAKGTYGVVSIGEMVGNKYKEYRRTVRADECGRKFFTWNRQRIYMDSYQAYSPDELVAHFNDKESSIFDEDLCHTLLRYGMDSLVVSLKVKPLERFNFFGLVLSFETSSNFDREEDFVWVDYKFVPDYLRMPTDCYKLKLVPLKEEEYDIYPKQDYYVSDLVSLIRNCDDFKIKVKEEA